MTTQLHQQITRRIAPALIGLAAIAALLGGCGSTAASSSASPATSLASAVGYTSATLADGQVDALPTGTLFANVISFAQPASSAIPAHSHVPVFVYVVKGTQVLTLEGKQPKTIQTGAATFLPNATNHTHANPDANANLWYVIAMRPRGVTTTPSSLPSTTVYATPDLPSFPASAYSERLLMATVQPGGRSASHLHSGLEVVTVLDGAITLHAVGHAPQTLTAGQGSYELSKTTLQIVNSGSSVAHYLAFVVWPVDQPFVTNVNQAP